MSDKKLEPEKELEREQYTRGEKISKKLKELTNNRLFLIIAGVILIIALVGGISSVIILRANLPAADGRDDQAAAVIGGIDSDIPETAQVLPQQQRINEDADDQSWAVFQPFVDPFSGPMRLTGVVLGGRGGAMAIIESSGTSYLVSEGDYVDDLWAVRSIYHGLVILRAHNQEVSLFFDRPPETRTIEPLWDEEEDDLEEDS